MFASPERLSSLSWIYVLLTARSACQSKGKQSFLDLEELATSQQNVVVELFNTFLSLGTKKVPVAMEPT